MTEEESNLIISPSILVIFGITGDLSQRKLIPALYRLLKNGLLHDKTQIIGITRRPVTVDELVAKAKTCILDETGSCDDAVLKKLKKIIHMDQMSAVDDKGYIKLQDFMDKIEVKQGMCLTRLFYLAIPPQILQPIVRHLGKNGLDKGCRRHHASARLLLEKPFGFDTETAKELIETTTEYFHEDQIFRIDHYLAKETVQNIIAFRFRNPIFETSWNCKHIESIEVVADEKIDIEGRADFYEQTGALRDLVQSHLLHVMSVIMMDKPTDLLDSDAIHASRLELLNSIQAVPADKIDEYAIRGQYKSYRKEVDNQASSVETFAALQLFSDDPNWQNVPIIVRTGKALKRKETVAEVKFRPVGGDHDHANTLTFNIQPDEGICVTLWAKRPGFDRKLQTVTMSFKYNQAFAGDANPDAYERVLIDAIRGDTTLFATSDEVLSAWRIIDPVIKTWGDSDAGLLFYTKGTDSKGLSAKFSN